MTKFEHHPAVLCATLAALALSVGTLQGCRGDRSTEPPRQFFPDLDDAPKWEPQGESNFFADGRMMRQPVTGTVPFGRQAFVPSEDKAWSASWGEKREDLLKADPVFYAGKDDKGAWIAKVPVKFSQQDLLRGQERYNISCASCHGYDGAGQGTVGAQWSYPLPNFHDEKYRDVSQDTAKDGYLYHIARNGVWSPDGAQNKMPGYAHALTAEDTWRIVAYIRVLQATRSATLSDVPEAQREKVRAAIEAAASAAPAGATTPATTPPTTPTTGGAP
jgi:mono/diheme cytochrome c family protein